MPNHDLQPIEHLDGFLPIERHALIGDCAGSALVAAVQWYSDHSAVVVTELRTADATLRPDLGIHIDANRRLDGR